MAIAVQESYCPNIKQMKNEKTNSVKTLTDLFRTFVTGIRSRKAVKPKEWLDKKGLSYETQQIGFNSGQFHHRTDEEFKKPFIENGMLKKSNAAVKSPELTPYTCFSPYSVVFPLKSANGDIVNLFTISCKNNNEKSQYLNDSGIYPSYPHLLTSRLFITKDVLDASSFLESKLLNNRDAVLALHDGELKEQHLKAISELNNLVEIVSFVDDTTILQKFSNTTANVLPVRLPDDHTINDMWVNYGADAILSLYDGKSSNHTLAITTSKDNPLIEIHKGRLAYQTAIGTFYVLGSVSNDFSTLKATIAFESSDTGKTYRQKLDLYERSHVVGFIKMVCEQEGINSNELDSEIARLTTHIEKKRVQNLDIDLPERKRQSNLLPPEKEREAIAFLSQPNVIGRMDELIAASGIIGEENNRKLVFVIASTYKMSNPLHGLIQGTSGSGKTHLINSISKLMPPEDVINLTRVTSKSFYHYQEDDLINKLILIQDIDGLDEDAMYAFRELQTSGYVSSSTIKKDAVGNLKSVIQQVNSKFASLSATTHAEIYFDNLSRSIVLGVDESEQQTLRIIDAQNNKSAGFFDESLATKAQEILQNCMRVLKPYEVLNRYANQIKLPVNAKMLRRLNCHFQDMVKQITLLNQFRRKQDEHGRLITEVEDLLIACEIMFDSIMWKVDELDSSLRQFFDKLKAHLSKQERGQRTGFSARETRQALNIEKSQMHRYVQALLQLEYIQISGGSSNRGYIYTVSHWDDINKIRQMVKHDLLSQIETIKQRTLGH